MDGYNYLFPSEINDDNSDKIENFFRNNIANGFYEEDPKEIGNNSIEQSFHELSATKLYKNNSNFLNYICEQEVSNYMNNMNNKIYFLSNIKNEIPNKIEANEIQTYIIDLSPKKLIKTNILEIYEKKKISYEYKENNVINKIYDYKSIINKLQKNFYPNTIIEKIKDDAISQKDKDSISLFAIKNKKIKGKNNGKQNIIKDKEEKEIKKGRKTLRDKIKGNHKKDSADNIIKKIKTLFFTCVIEYIEIFLKKYKKNYEREIILLKLDYAKYINRLKKDVDLKLLNKPLKYIASLDISKKYHKINDVCWNKKIIEKILEKEKDNKEINDLLNMSFNEWIDIFIYKKDWEYNIKYDKLRTFIGKMSEEDDEEYFSRFIFYLYNYKRWFLNKLGRDRDKSNIIRLTTKNNLFFRIKIN